MNDMNVQVIKDIAVTILNPSLCILEEYNSTFHIASWLRELQILPSD